MGASSLSSASITPPTPTPSPSPSLITTLPGFYVATNGSDTNDGSYAAPFLTPAAAQIAMRASTSTKTTYIRAGTYSLASTLNLTSADNGETWSYYPDDGYNHAILDGGGTLTAIIAIQGGSNITINGLKIQNAIQYGIYNHGGSKDSRDTYAQTVAAASNNIFENNEITGMSVKGLTTSTSPNSWESGCISNNQETPNTQVLNNYCHDVNSMGMPLGASSDLAPTPGDFSGTVVEGNYITRTCLVQNDCGAIYFWNPNSVKSTNITVKNNFVKDYSPSGNLGHAIYFDYESSNITVTGNIVSGATNTAAIMVSDGDNNVFMNNLFDVENGTIVLMDYLNITGHQSGTGNVFTNNIVLANATAFTTPTGVAGGSPFLTSPNKGPLTNIEVENNFYCNYHKIASGPYPDTGNQFGDTKPVFCAVDPGISGWSYTIAPSSAVFAAGVSFTPLPTRWGPPGFVVPQTGTAPSSPIN